MNSQVPSGSLVMNHSGFVHTLDHMGIIPSCCVHSGALGRPSHCLPFPKHWQSIVGITICRHDPGTDQGSGFSQLKLQACLLSAPPSSHLWRCHHRLEAFYQKSVQCQLLNQSAWGRRVRLEPQCCPHSQGQEEQSPSSQSHLQSLFLVGHCRRPG